MTEPTAPSSAPDAPPEKYRVLARKYRPTTFGELIGQDALVTTLTNAIASDRLAHAFVMTGVRGVGKTTTARLIARALNCIGADGNGGPTITPCGVCEHCISIAQDRHVDVMELDAASRTGVDDVREIIEGVRYRPTSARYKIYIIDEVHMLSRNAFNALLKTLEEPPEHVKFIFATTEIRKVPVTVLSRCQRFDLRRVDQETLSAHFARISTAEKAEVDPGALALISRAADGSVRDGLSLLDQAIAHSGRSADGGGAQVSEQLVRDMLGLADRIQTFDLLDATLRGEVTTALENLAEQYKAGADPVVVLQDMLELTHWLTRLKVAPNAVDGAGVAEAERVRGAQMAQKLGVPALTRAWQMLLKGLGETQVAPSPLQAAEMILVRMAYAAHLPTPAEAIKKLQGQPGAGAQGGAAAPSGGGGGASAMAQSTVPSGPSNGGGATAMAVVHDAEPTVQPVPEPQVAVLPNPQSFDDVVALAKEMRIGILGADLVNNVHLVSFAPAQGDQPGRIEFHPGDHADTSLAGKLTKFLNDATQRRWVVTISTQPGQSTIHQKREAAVAQRLAEAGEHPLVRKVVELFPGAKVTHVRELDAEELEPLAVDEAASEPDDQ